MRSFTRSVRAQQPDAMLWGALESCPEGDDWKRALHALGAMRRMCRVAQTRYINIRLRKSRVNFVLSRPAPSHQKAGHRAKAQVVPRAGVVNARRPGRRPGRSAAKSIDDAEHGARHETRDGATARSGCRNRHVPPEQLARTSRRLRFDSSAALFRRIWTRTRARGRRVRPARTGAQTATCGTTNDGVNDPVSTAWGHPAGQGTGVVHAIVGSATATPAAVVTAAQSAASMTCSRQVAAIETLAHDSRSWGYQG